jgi:hypothetical protein
MDQSVNYGGNMKIKLVFGILSVTLILCGCSHDDAPAAASSRPESHSSGVAAPEISPVNQTPKEADAAYAEALKKEANDLGSTAYGMARNRVLESLKAPDSAKFRDAFDRPFGYHQWKVGGTVTAQNSFGAMLKQDWFAVVTFDGVNWRLPYLRLGSDEIGSMPHISVAPPRALTDSEVAAARQKADAKKTDMAASLLKYHQSLADKGDPYGWLQMGKRYLTGDGVAKDEVEARRLLSLASRAGQTEATKLLEKTDAETAAR